ncbi:MAG: hypothetical protein LBJ00_02760 [Planctomycetaceae bacterium]|jgi:hypothetical protein|nr:hypothetical protein [Planctomycetaceae bacterium]
MKNILPFIFIVILILLNFIALGSGVAFSQVATVVYSNERSFSLPFQVLNSNGVDRASEVELLVSKDRGVRWYSVGRKPVDVNFFLFEADSDGEYWFSFRTIMVSGAVKRSANNSPQIRVIIDTSNLTTTQKPDSATNTLQKPNSLHNHNTAPANINTLKVANGILMPPKPIVFAKEFDKVVDKKKDRIESNAVPNLPNQIEPKTQQSNIADLIFSSDIANGAKTNNAENIELSQKAGKTERRVELLLQLADDFGALFKNEVGIWVGGNKGTDVVVVKGNIEEVGAVSGEVLADNREAGKQIEVVPNNNNNNVRETAAIVKSAEIPRAEVAEGAGAVANNYDLGRKVDNELGQDKTQDKKLDREVSKIRITGVTKNIASNPSQVIVKWGGENLVRSGVLADVMRGETAAGPWQPIAIGLPNNGEYWWYISSEDKKPFYLMIRTRNSFDIICETISKSAITVGE